MTGKITVGTIQDTDGNTVASTFVTEGTAKYFIHFGMNDFAIDASLNSSSVVDEGVGHATCNFTNNMSQVRYSYTGYVNGWTADNSFSGSNPGIGVDYDTCTTKSATTGIGVNAYYNTASIDGVINCVQTFGSIA